MDKQTFLFGLLFLAAPAAWHEQEALLPRRRREVGLVEDALRGAVFVKKL